METSAVKREDTLEGDTELSHMNSEKYLGQIISSDGKNTRNIKKIRNKGIGIQNRIIQMIEANYKIKTGEAETAIFAFSNNFFDNKGTLKDSFVYENDLDEAIRIMKNISKS